MGVAFTATVGTDEATTIDQVIKVIEGIIEDSENNNNPLGYFAALYLKVTKSVKQGIDVIEFEDNDRMEKFDVIFANLYIKAYFEYQNHQTAPESWNLAFNLSTKFWPIVLQQLLIGMNAHINLDLGHAAAVLMKGQDINDLKGDFDKINEVLASLVGQVETSLSKVWPTLKVILKFSGKVDDFLINFSMGIARDGAWKFATELAASTDFEQELRKRDAKVAKIAKLVKKPGFVVSFIFKLIRLGERGTVKQKILKIIN
ncbi:MAG: hypothetical protein HRT88_11355 [Lentisphaeraceae bacterium]|nr:hypothetical protein [Lentisphaeraceae bacterium]